MNASTTDRTLSHTPGLSVVIASTNHEDLLNRCLDALLEQANPHTVEVIVVRASDRLVSQRVASSLQWINAPAGSTVPQLRGFGIAAAAGRLVAFIEDDCVVDARWCEHALAITDSIVAVGGAVEPGPYRRALDWAVYFCEYGRFMLPVPAVPNAPVPGNNVIIFREALVHLPDPMRREFEEVFAQEHWRVNGQPSRADGSLVVHNVNTWATRHITLAPFHHGRAYGATRHGARPFTARCVIALMTLGLPVIQCARVATQAISRRRLRGRVVIALPWILTFHVSWSVGEAVGSLLGPGTSRSFWR